MSNMPDAPLIRAAPLPMPVTTASHRGSQGRRTVIVAASRQAIPQPEDVAKRPWKSTHACWLVKGRSSRPQTGVRDLMRSPIRRNSSHNGAPHVAIRVSWHIYRAGKCMACQELRTAGNALRDRAGTRWFSAVTANFAVDHMTETWRTPSADADAFPQRCGAHTDGPLR